MGSLILGPFDLLDPTSQVILSSNQQQLADFGAGVPDTTAVVRLLTDGEVVTGTRTSNRTLILPLVVRAPSRQAMAAAVALVAETVAQAQWQLTWTPDPASPAVVFDCYRGSVVQGTNPGSIAPLLGAAQGFVWLLVTIPALPFTRDVTPVTLDPTAPSGGVQISTMDATAGLVPADPAGALPLGPPNDTSYDTPPPVLVEDTATMVSGSGSVQVRGFVQAGGQFTYSGGGIYYTYQQTTYAAVPAVTIPLGAATDFSGQQNVYFSAKGDFTAQQFPAGSTVYADVGADSDPTPGVSTGQWVVTLIDSTGKRSSSSVTQLVGSGWQRVYANVQGTGVTADAGFDLTRVVSVRIRYYARLSGGTASQATLELLPNAGPPSTAFVNLTNATLSGSALTASAAGNAEGSWNQTAPVTSGQAYSGEVLVGNTGTFQVGIEWLNGSGTVLSTTWGSSTAAPSYGGEMVPAPGTFGDYESQGAYPAYTVSGTAPTGAVSARLRLRAVAATAGEQFTLTEPHLTAGSTPRAYEYGNAPTVTLWVDDVNAQPAGAGAVLTTPYAVQQFTGVGGSARTPVSMAVNVAGGLTARRLLVARTPNPPGNFNPFLITPTGSPSSTTDSTAIGGKYYNPTSSTTISYSLPASSLNGTYAVLARIKPRTASQAFTPTVTAQVGSGVAQTISRAWAGSVLPTASWNLVPIGALTLPPQGVGGANTAATITISVSDATSNGHYLDMLVLVDQAGEAVLIDLPSGTGYQWFWLNAPGPTDFFGSVMAGTAADGSDAISVAPWLFGQPVVNFDPGQNALTVLLDQATSGGTVQISYYRKWPGEAGSP